MPIFSAGVGRTVFWALWSAGPWTPKVSAGSLETGGWAAQPVVLDASRAPKPIASASRPA